MYIYINTYTNTHIYVYCIQTYIQYSIQCISQSARHAYLSVHKGDVGTPPVLKPPLFALLSSAHHQAQMHRDIHPREFVAGESILEQGQSFGLHVLLVIKGKVAMISSTSAHGLRNLIYAL